MRNALTMHLLADMMSLEVFTDAAATTWSIRVERGARYPVSDASCRSVDPNLPAVRVQLSGGNDDAARHSPRRN